jgi:hypothetical protein
MVLGCRGVAVLLLMCVLLGLSPVAVELGRVVVTGFQDARLVSARGGPTAYFAGGMWRTDARTLTAMLHYLLEAEPQTGDGQLATEIRPSMPVARFAPSSQNKTPAAI